MNRNCIFLLAFLAATFCHAQWPITPDTAKQVLLGSFFNNVIGDGQGNTIVIGRSGLYTAQKVDKNGQIVWDASRRGMAVVIPDSANDGTFGPSYLLPDGKGGVYIAYDYYDFLRVITNPERVVIYDFDTYVQHLDNNGRRVWGNKGVALTALKGLNFDTAQSMMAAFGGDGQGGVLAVYASGFRDTQGNAVGGVHIQRLDASGTRLWEENGRMILSSAAAIKAIVDQKGSAFVIAYRSAGPNIIVLSLAKISVDGQLLWERPLSTPIDNLINGKIISDTIGGCYIVIPHEQKNIKAFWFDSNGNQPWGGNGVFVVSNVNRLDFIQDAVIHSDGGFVCAWSEFRGDSITRGLYTQYVDKNGQQRWGVTGLPISAVPSGKARARLLKSSDNDFIYLFGDLRDNAQRLYAQKIDKNGIARWSRTDVLVSSRTVDGLMVSDGAGGAIVSWAEFSPRIVYVQKVDKNGNLGGVVSVKEPKDGHLLDHFDLYQNHPNPFLNETTIQYSLASGPLPVSLKIYNLLGEEVVTLINQIQTPGRHTARWSGVNQNGLPVAAGIYFYKLQIGQNHLLKKLAVIR